MIDWSAWISTGSAVVSAVMAGITVWWPWHNRPQADWTLLRYSTHPDIPLSATVPGLDGWLKRRGEREPDFICGIYNSGDGAAYDVKVDSIGCKAYFLQITDDGTNTKFLTPQPDRAGGVHGRASAARFQKRRRRYHRDTPDLDGAADPVASACEPDLCD